jgi:hypothetical protein
VDACKLLHASVEAQVPAPSTTCSKIVLPGQQADVEQVVTKSRALPLVLSACPSSLPYVPVSERTAGDSLHRRAAMRAIGARGWGLLRSAVHHGGCTLEQQMTACTFSQVDSAWKLMRQQALQPTLCNRPVCCTLGYAKTMYANPLRALKVWQTMSNALLQTANSVYHSVFGSRASHS